MDKSSKNTTPLAVKLITLGCPKNQVDSDAMSTVFKSLGFHLVRDDEECDIGIVNTCGFIEEAKQESINTILTVAKQKEHGKMKLLGVTGCLSQRYISELPDLLPEVDLFVGTGDFLRLPELIQNKLNGKIAQRQFSKRDPDAVDWIENHESKSLSHSQYVKISEGCSHQCTFCSIPVMRGTLKSRPQELIIQQIRREVETGVKEFNLIAQDLNEYGRDLTPRSSLYSLIEDIGKISGDFWLRPLYMYPLQFPKKLIQLLKDHPHFCRYVDIPLQHIDDNVLKSMKRGSSSLYIRNLLEELKSNMPDIALRTTFITGYPGETDAAFERLCDFIQEVEFDHLGVFTYSNEDHTPATKYTDQIPQKIREERKDELMKIQQDISRKKKKSFRGRTLKAIYEGYLDENDTSQGKARHQGQAPEIDGEIFIQLNGQTPPPVGAFIQTKIVDSLDYDLIGEIMPQ